MGPPTSCLSILGISDCAIRLGLRSLEDDVPETDGGETDAPETDVPETEAPEMDVTETEEGRDGGGPRLMSPRRKVCVYKDCGRLEWVLLSD